MALEDPHRAVRDLVAWRGSDFLFEATLTVSKSSAALTNLNAIPAALVLHGETYRAAPVAAVDVIARHLRLVACEQDLATAVSARRRARRW